MDQGGVLLIGYEMFRLLSTQRESKGKKGHPKKKTSEFVNLAVKARQDGQLKRNIT